MVNWERRTWATIYITLKWDPKHVFPSVRQHDQLMVSQWPTCFLWRCSVSFFSGLRFISEPLYFLWLVHRVKTESEPFPPSPLWIFYLFQPDWICFVLFFLLTLSAQRPCCFARHPLPPIFHSSLSPRVWFLGYALLTHSDSPAIWTSCLSTDNHMLSKYSSGKIYFLTNCVPFPWSFSLNRSKINVCWLDLLI